MKRPGTPETWKVSSGWMVALVFGTTLACYWPALHGGLLWDDDAHVTKPALRSLEGFWQIWSNIRATQQYYPLLHSAFWIEHRVWGGATLGYHLTNVVLHALSALLIIHILEQLKVPGARLAGLIFAVHPVCVESVAWISEQKNTLSLVFYLLSASAYLRFDRDRPKPAGRGFYLLALLFFVCALLTKTVTATLPAALLLLFWWQRGRLKWRDTWPLLPWFALSAGSGLLTALIERKLGGAEGAPFDLTFVERVLLAGRVIWFYLEKLLWPTDLMFVYPRWDAKASHAAWVGYLATAAALTAALWLFRKRSRGPLAAWLFFVGSLFPALGFFNVYPFIYSYVADHFQYLGSIGIISGFSAGGALILNQATNIIRTMGRGFLLVLVAVLGVLSNRQARVYVDPYVLYQTTIRLNPECWLAYNNLGTWYADQEEYQEAIVRFQEALRIKPDLAEAEYNLGNTWVRFPGQLGAAVTCYERALRLRPDYPEAHLSLGNALLRIPDRLNDAIAHFSEALRLKPDYAEAHNSLGYVLSEMPGQLNEGIAQLQEALRLQPDYAEAHLCLGNAYSQIPSRIDEAVVQYQEAIRFRPNGAEAHYNLGNVWLVMGRLSDAIVQYETAIRLKPGYFEARYNLAVALLRVPGRAGEARDQLEAALQLQPSNDAVLRMLTQIRTY